MKRRVIQIDQAKCSGCGLCVSACHEGAIQMVDGKATLIRDDYCDGLGDCLPACPENAISFIEREAAPYDEAAVQAAQRARKQEEVAAGLATEAVAPVAARSELTTWPIQIKLANPQSPHFQNASLLVAADCTAFAYGAFHSEFLKDRVCVIGCPKLDGVDYSQKLQEILALNSITEVVVTRMQVPCCGGLENAVRKAIAECGHEVALRVVTIANDGTIISESD